MTVPQQVRRVLIIEGDESMRALLCLQLENEHFDTTAVRDGAAAVALAEEQSFDAVVLSAVRPTVDGQAVCGAIRQSGPNRTVPILMLTPRRDGAAAAARFDSGADDYLTVPFDIRDMLARLNALLRTPQQGAEPPTLRRPRPRLLLLGLEIDPARHRVEIDGRVVSLTRQEFNLLYLMASRPGAVFDRDELLAQVWHDNVHVVRKGVDGLVKRLRSKIEREPRRPTRIITVRGAGYRFAEP